MASKKRPIHTHTHSYCTSRVQFTHTQTWHKNAFLLAHSRCQWCDRTINCIVFPDPYQTHIDSFRDWKLWLWPWQPMAYRFNFPVNLALTWPNMVSTQFSGSLVRDGGGKFLSKIQILKQVKPIENFCFSILKEITVLCLWEVGKKMISNSQMF